MRRQRAAMSRRGAPGVDQARLAKAQHAPRWGRRRRRVSTLTLMLGNFLAARMMWRYSASTVSRDAMTVGAPPPRTKAPASCRRRSLLLGRGLARRCAAAAAAAGVAVLQGLHLCSRAPGCGCLAGRAARRPPLQAPLPLLTLLAAPPVPVRGSQALLQAPRQPEIWPIGIRCWAIQRAHLQFRVGLGAVLA